MIIAKVAEYELSIYYRALSIYARLPPWVQTVAGVFWMHLTGRTVPHCITKVSHSEQGNCLNI
jgi:hypothetical protein